MTIPRDPDPDHPNWVSTHAWPSLYEHEVSAAGKAGTVVAYRLETFHRGTDLTAPRGARYTIHVNFRRADSDWIGRRSWTDTANTAPWQDFVYAPQYANLRLSGSLRRVTHTGPNRPSPTPHGAIRASTPIAGGAGRNAAERPPGPRRRTQRRTGARRIARSIDVPFGAPELGFRRTPTAPLSTPSPKAGVPDWE